jgi:hypothetical protein
LLTKRRAELVNMQDRLLNACFAAKIDEAASTAKSDVSLVTVKKKPSYILAKRPDLKNSRVDWTHAQVHEP